MVLATKPQKMDGSPTSNPAHADPWFGDPDH